MKHILALLTIIAFCFHAKADNSQTTGVLAVVSHRVAKVNVEITKGYDWKWFHSNAKTLLAASLTPNEIRDIRAAIDDLFITLGHPRLSANAEKFFLGYNISTVKDDLADLETTLADLEARQNKRAAN